MSGFDRRRVTQTYSAVADDYAKTYAGHVDRLDVDREMLDATARRVTGDGPVVDLGCGPAHVGGYLAERGCHVVGADAALGMLAVARRRNPRCTRMTSSSVPSRPSSSWSTPCATATRCPRSAKGTASTWRRPPQGDG